MGLNLNRAFKKYVKGPVEKTGRAVEDGIREVEDRVVEPIAKDIGRKSMDVSIKSGILAEEVASDDLDSDVRIQVTDEKTKEATQELADLKNKNEQSRKQLENQERAMIQSLMRSSSTGGASSSTILTDQLGTEASNQQRQRFVSKSLLGA